jgi:hypothetical protein
MLYLFMIDDLFNGAHFFGGLILMILSLRGYLKTRATSMIYLIVGFSLITVGDLFSAIYYIDDLRMYKLLSQGSDLLGLIALIIAVEKS